METGKKPTESYTLCWFLVPNTQFVVSFVAASVNQLLVSVSCINLYVGYACVNEEKLILKTLECTSCT